jgi:3-oxoadipate enol-lactonase
MPKAQIADVGLYYEWHGREDAPVLVLVNGILMNAASSWVHQTAAFARSYRVLQHDCRGQGLSDHPDGPYSMATHADDLAGLLDHLGVGRAHVLGISYGGEVAQAFALRHGTHVRSLVLADTVSGVGPELRLVVEAWRGAALAGDANALFAASAPWNFSPGFIAANEALMREARRRYLELDLPAVARLCDAFLAVDFTERLSEIAAPACVIVGNDDILKGPAYARRLASRLPRCEMHVIEGAGHAVCWERPEVFNTVVLGFLAKQI